MKIGLSTVEAKKLLDQWGTNEVTQDSLKSFFSQAKKILLDPMGMMLLILSALYWGLGDKPDSIILFCAFFPVVAIDVLLEIRSGKALKALKSSMSTTCKVYRDGVIKDLPIREVVPGDVVVFEEGQALVADGLVTESEHLHINEAALTGESIAVKKENQDLFLAGTTVLSGRGLGLVQKTGKNSRFGEIAEILSRSQQVKSPLRKRVDSLMKIVMIFAVLIAVSLFAVQWFRTGEIVPSLILALTLGMATMPSEFPLVYTLYLSTGAWRLSKRGLLVKSLPSVEALGGVDVICTDKTGTLTEGLFLLEELKLLNDLSEDKAWQAALMACEPHAVDSLEIAIFQKAEKFKNTLDGWQLLHDFPFENQGKHMSHVWRSTSGQDFIAMKGSVEGVIEHCQLNVENKNEIEKITAELSSSGKRVLALAGRELQATGQREKDERELTFIGFLSFSDPVRSNVKESIVLCQSQGIEVKMLTGDHLLTAHAVADQIGLEHEHQYLYTGSMLSVMSEPERKKAYLQGALFARVLPEQKYEMIKILQDSGKVVAMTGDGINDATALKLADIGISMGRGATDVARSTAQMILLENNFSSIVYAVFEGRKIFSNLRRSFSYLIAFHIPVILLAMLPPFLGWPALLMPLHIVILELLVHPVSAFTFENIESKNLEKNIKNVLLTRSQVLFAVARGVFLSVVALFLFQTNLSVSTGFARSMAFEVILIGNIFLVLVEVPFAFNKRVLATVIVLMAFAVAIVRVPILSQFFHLQIMTIEQLVVCVASVLLLLVIRKVSLLSNK
jgi:Ca2+-transporting ATPase